MRKRTYKSFDSKNTDFEIEPDNEGSNLGICEFFNDIRGFIVWAFWWTLVGLLGSSIFFIYFDVKHLIYNPYIICTGNAYIAMIIFFSFYGLFFLSILISVVPAVVSAKLLSWKWKFRIWLLILTFISLLFIIICMMNTNTITTGMIVQDSHNNSMYQCEFRDDMPQAYRILSKFNHSEIGNYSCSFFTHEDICPTTASFQRQHSNGNNQTSGAYKCTPSDPKGVELCNFYAGQWIEQAHRFLEMSIIETVLLWLCVVFTTERAWRTRYFFSQDEYSSDDMAELCIGWCCLYCCDKKYD